MLLSLRRHWMAAVLVVTLLGACAVAAAPLALIPAATMDSDCGGG
jgi:hypothetical protein